MELDSVRIENPERKNLESWAAFVDAVNSRDKLELSIPEQTLEFILSNEEFRKGIFIAYLQDEIIGFAGCMKNISKPQDASLQVIIHPDYRQRGLGSRMYDIIFEHAKMCGVKNIAAFAKEHMQQAMDFVQKRGFKPDKYSWKMDLNIIDNDYRTINMDNCRIRRITIEDNKDYIAIMNAGFKKDGDELYTEKSFELTLRNPDTYVFFIEQDGKITATAAVGLESTVNRGYIHNVTVYKEYRGKGFGEMALNHCINKIKEANLSKASLNVYGDNKGALSLYKKLGFLEVDTDITFKGEI